MACKFLYNDIKFNTRQEIVEYINNGSPSFADIVAGGTFKQALDFLDTQLSTNYERTIFKAIQSKLKSMPMAARIVKIPMKSSTTASVHTDWASDNTRLFELRINPNSTTKFDATVFLHELVHMATQIELTYGVNTAAKEQLRQIREQVNLELKFRDLNDSLTKVERRFLEQSNALKDEHEILAWGLTDPEFQDVLRTIPFKSDRTLWDIFIDAVLSLIGLSRQHENALTAVIASGVSILRDSELVSYQSDSVPALQHQAYKVEDLKQDSNNLERDDATSIYTDAATKQQYDAVTGKVIPLFQHQPFDPNFDPGKNDADRIWKNTPKDVPQNTWISGDKPISYEEHALAVNENRERFIARAELYHLKFHSYFSKDGSIRNKMSEIMTKFGISDSEIDWLSETSRGKTAIQDILERRTGTDFWQPNGVDKIATEIAIKSDILGWAGRVDLMIDHGNDILSFFDIKTGYGINREFQKYFLNYGDTMGREVWDNALNRAKLQLMLYAVIAKSERPELKFRNLKVLHVPSENDKHYDSIHNTVDVPAFLEIVKNFLQDRSKDKYDKLLAKSPNIFNPEHYNAITYSSIGDKMRADADPAMELRLRILELQSLVMYDKNLIDKVVQGKKSSSDRAKRIAELMEQIITLKGDKSISYAAWDTDMSWMDNWLGSASYSTNPYIQIYHKILSEQKQLARNKYETWRAKFNKLLQVALEEIGATSVTNYVGGPDRDALFQKLLVTNVHGETSTVELVTKDSAKWSELTEKQKALAQFMTDSIGYFFDNELTDYVDPRTGKKIALANQVATYVEGKNGTQKAITNLALHNRELKRVGMNSKVDKFAYKAGFYPKHAPLISDIARQHGGYLNRGMLKYLWNKNTTNYFEVVYDQWGNTTEAIPMKFLGNSAIDYSKNFTMNAELAVDAFVKQHFYKQYLDPVYTYGLGMKLYLAAKQNAEENTSFKKTISWFEDSINLHILGRKDITDDWVTRKFKKSTLEGWQQFNFTKFLRSLRNFFSGPTMWLKPITGIANAVFASLVTIKEAVKNSAFIKGPHSNFGIGDLAAGFSVGLGMQFDAAAGKLRENKAYLLMEKFGYLPDSYDWYTRPNELLTTRNKLFTSKTMMFFHAVPEEVVATAMFVAQLKSMGVWDHYNVVDGELSDGTTYKTIKWDGTIRGKRNVSNVDNEPLYEDVTELIPEEIAAIKFLYEKIHGGYRLDERVRAEYYVMGELIMQFKKYMPGVMKNVLASRGYRSTQGFLDEVIDDQGNKVLKWTPQVVEGRWRLLFGLVNHYLGLKRQVNPQGEIGSKLSEALKAQPNQSYDWSKLSETQKEDVIDSILTFGMWMLLLVGYNFAWDRDDQDSLKKIYARIMNDINLQVNPIEVINNAINFGRPVTINKFAKLLNSSVETFWSTILWAEGDDAAFTEQGNLRGMKEFQRNLHILSSYHDVNTFLSGSPDLQELLNMREK